MKFITLIGIILFSILIMSNSECTPPQNNEHVVHTDSTFVHTTFSKYRTYGKNVVYFEVTDAAFATNLQDWITANPSRVVTAIGYDATSGNSNLPEGYFIIHYPDTAFTLFRIKK